MPKLSSPRFTAAYSSSSLFIRNCFSNPWNISCLNPAEIRPLAWGQVIKSSRIENFGCHVFCVVNTINSSTDNGFGSYVRERREALRAKSREFSLRQVASRIGVEPSYLSKVERGDQPPPGEATICALAEELRDDPDMLLAMAGKVSTDLQAIIRQRPALFAQLLRELKDMPEKAVLRLVREVRDGDW